MVNVTDKRKPQVGRGKTQKQICPCCSKAYLKSAWGKEGTVMRKIGLYCPSCDYITKACQRP